MDPLERKHVDFWENEKRIQVPALSQKWVEGKKFLHFLPPPPITAGIDWKEWIEMANFIKSDLHWLLKLPHHKFWSQIVYDESLHGSLVSFLQEAPRFYSEETKEALKASSDSWEIFKDVQKLVLLTFLRMSTPKESKDYFITPSVFGDLIYDNFIFDIPKLMDLCALFGPTSNSTLLSKMLHSIFQHQPKYLHDLEETGGSLIQVFHLILGKLGLEDNKGAGSGRSGPLTSDELNDIAIYVLDVAATLWYFIDAYPPSAAVLIIAGLHNQLVEFYENCVPCLSRQIELVVTANKDKMLGKLDLARKFLLQVYNALLHSVSIKPILIESSEELSATSKETSVEQWLEWLTHVIAERHRHFLIDYNSVFPLQDDIDLMTQMGISIDTTRVEYVKGGLKGFAGELGMSLTPAAVRAPDGGTDPAKMASLVQQVKELMPDMRDDFIEVCLKHYDYNAEAVINAILEENLPPHLVDRPIPDIHPVAPNPTASRLHDEPAEISKKARTKTVHFDEMREVLNDQVSLKNVILERVNEQLAADEYDDEYDDTYDEHAVGSEEPDAHVGEEDRRRSFVVPRVLRPKGADDGDEEEEEDDEEPTNERPRDQFVPNPAELREQAEQRRLARRGHRHPGPAAVPRNVVGGPRGQGQDKETIQARRNKMENKGRGANHNRRSMADRKRREF